MIADFGQHTENSSFFYWFQRQFEWYVNAGPETAESRMINKHVISPLIHIGFHKTATSLLQTQIFTDETRFSLPWGSQSASAVDWFVLAHPERFSASAARADFFSKNENLKGAVPVITHERLSGNPFSGEYLIDRVSARLHETFPEAKIVIGVREQRALLVSLYYQYVRQGGAMSIKSFLPPQCEQPGFQPKLRLDHFEYDLTLGAYRRYWDAENILILPMELLKVNQNAYLEKLFHFVGLNPPETFPLKKVNEKSPALTMRLERLVNRIIPTPDIKPVNYSDNPLLYRIKRRSIASLGRFRPLQSVGTAENERIKAYVNETVGTYFNESNQRLAEMTNLDLRAFGYF